MTQYTLLMLEISGIQPYIFGTNSLSVNVGASALVATITREWVAAHLPDDKHNIDANGQVQTAALEDNEELLVEAIYLGGGNALLIFRDTDDVVPFIKGISRQLLLEAPDLRVAIKQMAIDWANDSLADKLDELRTRMADHKQQPPPSRLLPGLGVSASCVFTGQPATTHLTFGPTDTPHLVAATVAAKKSYQWKAEQYFKELYDIEAETGMKPVTDFEYFGTPGEASFIAVVHADGNRMGERIKALGKERRIPAKNREYANLLRNFSRSSKKAARVALQSTVECLKDCHNADRDGNWYWQRVGLPAGLYDQLPIVKCRGQRFPFRPIVFGGDDVTFVCDGRLGLALAQHYLKMYGKQSLADGQMAVGRAGIAIVNTHYPFAQAYDLAEKLAGSAKTEGEDGMLASLDWHFGVNGVLDSLETIRKTSYTVSAGPLHLRPLRLKGKDERDYQHWHIFDKLVSKFQIGDDWRDKRSKLKGLQTALRGGIAQTRAFLTNYGLKSLPPVDPTKPQFETDGWVGGESPYFDALEAMDFFIPLEEPA